MRGRGECSVRQRRTPNGAVYWEARASVNGRQVSFYGKTKTAALAKARQARADSERGAAVFLPTVSVANYLVAWLESINVRRSTREAYATVVRRHIVPAIGSTRLALLTPSAVEGMLAGVVASGLSEAQARKVKAVLRTALARAERDLGLPRNVARLARMPKSPIPRFEPERLTVADVRAVLAAVAGDRIEPAVRFSVATGVRHGELLALRHDDITGTTVTIRHSVERASGYRQITRPKGGRERMLALAPMAVLALEAERAYQDQERELAGPGWCDTRLVFAGRTGGILPSGRCGDRLRTCLARAGLAPIRWHALRRMFAAVLLDQGVPLHRIRDLLGHTHVQITEHYAYTMADSLMADMAVVDAALGYN